jgi:Zn-dependent peptidase ImmA (M78 family)/transcriptional regulator with XRE-family HTH domain
MEHIFCTQFYPLRQTGSMRTLSRGEVTMDKHILQQIDPKALGSRLQEARKSRGLNQQAVADEMKIARTTLVAIEKGERRITPHELIQLASLYARSISEFISRPFISVGFVPQFRSNWKQYVTQESDLEQTAAELQSLAEDYVELERLSELPLSKAYPPPYQTAGPSPEQTAEEIATAERNRLGIGDGPISNLRARLENDVGLRIFFFPMVSKVSGVFAYNDELGACFGINANHPRDRRNWSLAHEYGHFLTNRFQVEITFLSPGKKQSNVERLADAFAENFLMPATGLNRRYTEMQRVGPGKSITLAQICNLADLYQVSIQALIIRLEKLRRLPAGTWDRLTAEGFKPRRAQQLLEIGAVGEKEELLPPRYSNLAVMAHMKGLISEGQLSKLLRLDRISSREIVDRVRNRFNAAVESGYEPLELDLAQPVAGR